MKNPSLYNITSKAESALNRFPLIINWSILGSIYFIIEIEESSFELLNVLLFIKEN
ncbi:hypothetical protein KO500_14165 [Cellulophaga baltica]|uniref:hypothetical protein n=1 Tax=Cellulophaga TaxID=104264 RepID=UPI001C07E7E0|nr:MULTISPECIES: hypothetical protein [Cellulophaga]MBU2997590.1 hypothetical protein [Cellulophaga baltica]MDO6768985.1 hypothetical protein [Cellulophaga sp. 1_MG-2023]